MTASDAEAFHKAAVERWKQEPDAIELLVSNAMRMHAEKAAAEQRAQAAESERDSQQRLAIRFMVALHMTHEEDFAASGQPNVPLTRCAICRRVSRANTPDDLSEQARALLRAAEGGKG